MKYIFLTTMLLSMFTAAFAQKTSFDAVSFTIPKGWQQQQNDGSMQLSITDKKTGGYAVAMITKATASTASANENFTNDWERLVKGSVQADGEPNMEQPASGNGWDIISGTANYTDGSIKGVATLLTATGGGQMVSVVLMTSTQQYQNDLLAFIKSLELKKAEQFTGNKKSSSTSGKSNNSSIAGLWIFYNTETNGNLTGGYMRREYVFYADGSYLFRAKDWMVFVKDIFFAYETGTYTVKGNQITIIPKKGKGEWWSKTTDGRTEGWGKLVKVANYKLETVTYSFELLNVPDVVNQRKLILTSTKPTLREGSRGNETNEHDFHYESRDANNSLIDNPPGVKTGFENKALNASASTQQQNNNNTISSTGISGNISIAGLWCNYRTEISGYSNGVPLYSGGYLRSEYIFNADGSYCYRVKNWLVVQKEILFVYEKGTYSVNDNQITITPTQGKGEWWSKATGGKTVGWGKIVKKANFKLETITYAYELKYFTGDNKPTIVLQSRKPTEREGGNNGVANSWTYNQKDMSNTLIDNPPGFTPVCF